jgi:zinc protease
MRKLLLVLLSVFLQLALAASGKAAALPERAVLDNGIVLLSSEQRALPMVSIELLIHAGSRYDTPNHEGLANLTARLLTYGTKRRSALEISESLDFIGASLSTDCGEDLATISMTILKKDLTTGLELLAEILTAAAFPTDEIDRRKQSIIASIRAKEENPGEIAQKRFQQTLYPDSPFGRPVEGTEASVKMIPEASLTEFYGRYYRPNRTIMAVVGDVSHQELTKAVEEAFAGWTKGEPPGAPLIPANTGSAENIRVNRELTQANIILGHAGVGRENPDYYAIQVMNYILGGGGFSSRLMESVRNERGLAYSVYSYFSAEKGRGSFQLVMQTKNDSAQQAIRVATDEMRRIRQKPVSEEDLNDAKDYLTGSFPLRFDTNRKVANFLALVEFFGLGLDYRERYPEFIRKVTGEDVLRVAKQYLHPEKLISVVVGNLKNISENQ